MADLIQVNTVSLNTTRENIAKQIEEIGKQVSEMYEGITALNAMWEGPAHDMFDAEFRADVKKLEILCSSLAEIVSYEENAVKEYNQCEKEVAELIENLKV